MALMRIGSVDLPNPQSYSVVLQDLDSDNTHRSETGYLSRERVRAGVYKISATWLVKLHDLKKIAQATTPDKFIVYFFDPNTASNKSAQMYASDRSSDLKKYINEKKPEDSWWEFSCSFTEY